MTLVLVGPWHISEVAFQNKLIDAFFKDWERLSDSVALISTMAECKREIFNKGCIHVMLQITYACQKVYL